MPAQRTAATRGANTHNRRAGPQNERGYARPGLAKPAPELGKKYKQQPGAATRLPQRRALHQKAGAPTQPEQTTLGAPAPAPGARPALLPPCRRAVRPRARCRAGHRRRPFNWVSTPLPRAAGGVRRSTTCLTSCPSSVGCKAAGAGSRGQAAGGVVSSRGLRPDTSSSASSASASSRQRAAGSGQQAAGSRQQAAHLLLVAALLVGLLLLLGRLQQGQQQQQQGQ
jgi:hypothetical protein